MISTSQNFPLVMPHAATSCIVCGGTRIEIVWLSTRANTKAFAFYNFFKQNLKLLIKLKSQCCIPERRHDSQQIQLAYYQTQIARRVASDALWHGSHRKRYGEARGRHRQHVV